MRYQMILVHWIFIPLVAYFLIFSNCTKKSDDQTTVTSQNLPDIGTFTSVPSTQFIIDTGLISTSAISRTSPHSGTASFCAHAGAHLHFQQTGSSSLVDVYSPVNGVIERVEKCFVVGANDKYEISIKFANNGGKVVSLSLSLEPFGGYLCSGGSSGADNGAFHSYILVNTGDTVTAGQLIGKMFVPAGAADDTHIHFHLNTETIGFSCPNIFSSGIADIFDNKFSSTACGGGAFPEGGLCSQPGANEDITTLE